MTQGVEWVLNSLFFADVVFLQKPKAIDNEPGKYQYLRTKASRSSLWHLFATLDRLAVAGIMTPSESVEYKQRILHSLVNEFAKKCPPKNGFAYRSAGLAPENHTAMLEIVPTAKEEK